MADDALLGHTVPRIFTPPLRELTPETSLGFEMAEWCESIGAPLLDWQRWCVEHLLELREDGRLRYRTALICVGRQSGKSVMSALLALWWIYRRNARLVVGLAQSLDVARETWLRAADFIEESEVLDAPKVYNANGKERLEWRTGQRYLLKAANRRARGLSPQLVVCDELREQTDWDAWQAIQPMLLAQPEGLMLALSSAGDESSVVMNQLQDAGRAAAEDSAYDGDLFLSEWSCPPGADVDDPACWAYGMPSMGSTVPVAAVRALRDTLPPAAFRTEVMGERLTSRRDGVIEAAAWESCADPTGNLEFARSRVTACLDVSRDGDHVSLAVAAQTVEGTVRVELAGAWSSVDEARQALPDLLRRIKAQRVGWYAGSPGVALAADVRRIVGDRAQEITRPAEACQAFASLVVGRRLMHGGQALLDQHVSDAVKLPRGDGWVFSRRDAGGAVDAVYAAAGATFLARQQPVPKAGRLIVAA